MTVNDIKENLRLLYNKIRIWWLGTFTNRVRHFEITDPDGKKIRATTETREEKVCDHKTIEEIAPTMWRCMKCPHAFFQINYKILLTRNDLISYIEKLASVFDAKLADKHEEQPNQE